MLDTTVLVARPVHQFIGTLGTEGAFDVAWSDELVSELIWKEKSRGELRVARDAAGVRLGFRRRWSA